MGSNKTGFKQINKLRVHLPGTYIPDSANQSQDRTNGPYYACYIYFVL